MEYIVVKGGKKLHGEVTTSGAKNAALPILFASLLAEGVHRFNNVPVLRDIASTERLLQHLNCTTQRDGGSLIIQTNPPDDYTAPYDLVSQMRASILCLGPLLSKYGQARVSLPGGCAIGSRPINLHIDPLRQMGAEIHIEKGYVIANCKRKLTAAHILFENTTVGGTENIMMAATLAEGTTVLENAAQEPEIVDLAIYLKSMGAKIDGEGSKVITITGVDKLTPSEHTIVPDRIEAGTLLIAGAITGGDVKVEKCVPAHIQSLIEKMRESGFTIDSGDDWVSVSGGNMGHGVDIHTIPHPGFPTDLQAQFMALMTQCEGASVITEGIFENRFMHVQELIRLGAEISLNARVAVVRGEKGKLEGAQVMATDLRASASLVLAGLVANGETQINRVYHLDRGYEKLEEKLASLGATIKRCA
ncbi:MAG: UDP-N-acetylglucosamine 1-carboxyvinyltransferase [Pseudomonadales bacterium]|nr:UDP-N-acetylglucosamine 1-carboxyvinyltransferase [Pseudomonadales bacterium]